MSASLAAALAVALVLEGLLPFISPPMWRKVFMSAAQMRDEHIRIFGLAAMLVGLAVLLMVR